MTAIGTDIFYAAVTIEGRRPAPLQPQDGQHEPGALYGGGECPRLDPRSLVGGVLQTKIGEERLDEVVYAMLAERAAPWPRCCAECRGFSASTQAALGHLVVIDREGPTSAAHLRRELTIGHRDHRHRGGARREHRHHAGRGTWLLPLPTTAIRGGLFRAR